MTTEQLHAVHPVRQGYQRTHLARRCQGWSKVTSKVETPWDDCKVAIGVDNDEPLNDSEIFESLCAGRDLPRGWVLDELDGTGARWVAVFRVAGFPTMYAGKRVRSVLRSIGALT